MCYRVSIYDKSKKRVATYEKIHTVKYISPIFGEDVVVTGEEMLTHSFPTGTSYQLLSDDGNYSIDLSVIGTFEVTKVCY